MFSHSVALLRGGARECPDDGAAESVLINVLGMIFQDMERMIF